MFGFRNNAQTQRAIVGNSAGALAGGVVGAAYNPSGGMLGQSAYGAFHGLGSAARLAFGATISGAYHAGGLARMTATAPFHAVGDWWGWRNRAAQSMDWNRSLADSMEELYPNTSSVRTGADGRKFRDNYGRQVNPDYAEINQAGRRTMSWKDRAIYGRYKPRRFGARSPWEHMKRGGQNIAAYTLFSPMSWGLNLAFAAHQTSDNLFDIREGFAASLATNIGAEIGFMAGGTAGAALATAAAPGLGLLAGVGFLGGAFMGASVAAAIPGKILDFAEWGAKNGRHAKLFRTGYQDSEQAMTMRQRGVQAIYRSQMSARSSMGAEAMSAHA